MLGHPEAQQSTLGADAQRHRRQPVEAEHPVVNSGSPFGALDLAPNLQQNHREITSQFFN